MKNSQCGFSHFVQEEVYIMAEKRTIESLIEQGKSSGKLSTKEITDVLEDLEYDVDQMESFYESCSNNLSARTIRSFRSRPRALLLTTP